MPSRKVSPPSPAMVVACVALAVALGGTTYAATALPRNSVGTPQIKKDAVTSPKVKHNAITGADVKESTLRRVPSATTAGTANAAFAAYQDYGAIALPTTEGPIATLKIPRPGKYVVSAKFEAFNNSGNANTSSFCKLSGGVGSPNGGAGGPIEIDQLGFNVGSQPKDDQTVVALQGGRSFPTAGQVALVCLDSGDGDVLARNIKVTAIQVAQLTFTSFHAP
jgi:hypothetical protein